MFVFLGAFVLVDAMMVEGLLARGATNQSTAHDAGKLWLRTLLGEEGHSSLHCWLLDGSLHRLER